MTAPMTIPRVDEPPWLTVARAYSGVMEIRGPQHNSLVVRMWELIKAPFRDDETPWCAAYVGAVLEECGFESTRSAAARSYLRWGVALDAPVPGCVVVFSRPGNAWSGHVGFVTGRDEQGRLMVLGGNQGDAVSELPFDRTRVLGYRWPAGEPLPDWQPLPVYARAGAASRDEA